MASFKQKVTKAIGTIVNSLSQADTENVRKNEPKVITEGMPELLRYVASQGAVLLKNDGVLPLKKGTRVSLFGRVQNDYMFVGYGSGGDVIKPYTVNLMEGLKNSGAKINTELADIYEKWCRKNPPDHGFWGHWPHYYNEMPITEDEINISAGEIGNIPNAPSNLAAFYVNDSLVNGAYKVKLTWVDTSDNENQFNIYVYKINQETSEKELGETITALPNENEKELTLDVGIYYDVEISSVNSVGESSISKRITGSTTDTTLTIISAEDFIFKEAE